MLGKSQETINTLTEVARKGLELTAQQFGYQKELITLNYFNEHRDALSQVSGLLKQSELIDFNNFLGLHLGIKASYNPSDLFGPNAYVYIPLFLLAILAVVTTFISTKLTMPKKSQNNGAQQNAMASSMTNSMMYIGPLMTLMFSFQLPAGVVLYWMIGYVFAIFQQLYINKYVLKKNEKPEQKTIADKKSDSGKKSLNSGNTTTEGNKEDKKLNTDDASKKSVSGNSAKGGNKKSGGNKKKGAK
jgi:YidC/Oxa1 family membrane protein insertase